MSAATGILYLEKGADYKDRFYILNPDGTPVDLSGTSFVLEAKINITDEAPWLRMDSSSIVGDGAAGGFTVDDTLGLVTASLPGAASGGLNSDTILAALGPTVRTITYTDETGSPQAQQAVGYPLVCAIEATNGDSVERIFDGLMLVSLEVIR